MTPTSVHARHRAAAALAVTLLALAAGCATRPDVRRDQDPAVDLKAYKTFSFNEATGVHATSLLEQHLRRAARTQLERQQYVYDEHDPDLRVDYALHVVDKQALRSTAGARAGWHGWSSTSFETVDYRQGMVVIDLVDIRRGALVWRGVAEGRLDAQATARPGPTIDAVVGELFAQFPGTRAN